MKFSTLLNACSIAVLSFIPLASAEDSSSPATVTFLYSASSSSGQTTTNLYLVESAHGYGMSIGGDEPTISASIENDTMVMICPYSGLQAALVPAADNVTWYLEWVAEDTVLPDGSKTDAFAIGDAVGWSQSTNVTVDTTIGDGTWAGALQLQTYVFLMSWLNQTNDDATTQSAIIQSADDSITC